MIRVNKGKVEIPWRGVGSPPRRSPLCEAVEAVIRCGMADEMRRLDDAILGHDAGDENDAKPSVPGSKAEGAD